VTDPSAAIRDDRAHDRFVTEESGAVAELIYHERAGRLVLIHTEVPPAFRGRGIGGELVKAAIARARSDELVLVPSCPFARRWLAEHPQEVGSVAIEWPES
jgi:predicted GNAT family acetyltransferase